MATDFNISDEAEDGLDDEDGNAVHAGDEVDDDETEDRGDEVTDGNADDDGSDAGEPDAEGEGGDETDPEFLASLADDEGGKTPKTVPYARLAEVTAQNQQLMQVLEAVASGRIPASQATAGQEPSEEETPAFDLKAKVRERNSALLEGDEDKAAEIDMEIEEHRNNTIRAAARKEALSDFQAAQQKTATERVVAEAFEKYTFLDDGSEDFNPEALDEVMMYRNHYMSKGDDLPEALAKAVGKVCPQYAGGDNSGEGAPKTNVRDAKKVLRNARAARAQPPQTAKAGTANRETIDVGKLDFENMDEDKFDALPEDVKAKARGDAVA